MKKFKKELSIALCGLAILICATGLIFSQPNTNKEMKYLGASYRDPFLSFLPEEKVEEKVEKISPPDLRLQGIVWGSPRPQAIINNTVLGKDDIIQGAQILEVKKEGVDFIYKGQHFILKRSGMIKVQGGTE